MANPTRSLKLVSAGAPFPGREVGNEGEGKGVREGGRKEGVKESILLNCQLHKFETAYNQFPHYTQLHLVCINWSVYIHRQLVHYKSTYMHTQVRCMYNVAS